MWRTRRPRRWSTLVVIVVALPSSSCFGPMRSLVEALARALGRATTRAVTRCHRNETRELSYLVGTC